VPVIVVSGASNISDKVLVLESGADDYVTKPFSPRELLARVHVALRHTNQVDTNNLVRFDDIVVDFNTAPMHSI
jgi:DNA-binding response OmpR family regulator